MTAPSRPDAQGEHLFAQLISGWEQAGGGEVERCFSVAESQVVVRGPRATSLERLCAALEHLASDELATSEAGLELLVYDSSVVAPPPMPFSQHQLTARGELHGFESERFRMAFRFGEFTLNAYDRERRRAVVWMRDARQLPLWYLASPFRTPLHWWASDRGLQLVHGAGVVKGGRAALIVGRGGSGKSSTALTCMERGFELLGDDYVIVGVDPATVWSLYSSVKVVPEQLEARSTFEGLAADTEESFDKSVFFLAEHRAERLASGAPLAVLLRAQVDRAGGPTRLEDCGPLEIDAAVSGDTLRHLPYAGHPTQEVLNRLSTSVPARRLLLGPERDAIAATVERALGEAPSLPLATSSDLSLPFVAVVVEVEGENSPDPGLIEALESEDYPRLEVLVIRHRAKVAWDAPRTEHVVLTSLHDERKLSRAEVFNRGSRESMAELVAFLSSSDRWQRGFLRSAVEFLAENPELPVVAGASDRGAGAGTAVESDSDSEWATAVPWLYRRGALDKIGGFDASEPQPERSAAERLQPVAEVLPGLELEPPAPVGSRRARDPRIEHVRQWLDRRRR
ncbi:MAG: hypothetical protein AAF690_23215 [Acidobacteriota bacterium]